MTEPLQRQRVVFTDLDGTLLGPDQTLSTTDRSTLQRLGASGIARVVVTGRSLLSCDRVIDSDFPIDFLVTSSGAGIFYHQPRRLMHRFGLTTSEIRAAIEVLELLRLDFMVHESVPENHRFHWRRFGAPNPDFDRRLALYAGHHRMLADALPEDGAQLLAIGSADDATKRHEELQRRLPCHNVLRTTSPLDHSSTWYEIFSRDVGKAQSAQWLCDTLDLDGSTALAVGNDFNDLDMLRWAPTSCVVSNAPSALTAEFQSVADHRESGFSEAVARWLSQTA